MESDDVDANTLIYGAFLCVHSKIPQTIIDFHLMLIWCCDDLLLRLSFISRAVRLFYDEPKLCGELFFISHENIFLIDAHPRWRSSFL